MKIVVTGSSGFVGSNVLKKLSKYEVITIDRKLVNKSENCKVKVIDSKTDYSNLLDNTHCIIHCAARVHIMKDESTNVLEDYREVNTAGTLNLARQAAVAGVQRFIFISSIKVNGESTNIGESFRTTDE